MKQLIVLIFIIHGMFFFNSEVKAQSLTWQRTYNGEFFNSSDFGRGNCTTPNGNIYVTGFELSALGVRAVVLKLKPNGDTIWTKYFNGFRGVLITSTDNEGCVITGESSSIYIMKLDSNGNMIWGKSYGMPGTRPSDMIMTNDGGFAISGYRSVLPSPAYILKLDSLGELKWQKYFYAGDTKYFNSLSQKSNGNYIISGYKYECEYCNGYPILLELNNSGDSLWEKKYNLFAEFKKIYSGENGYLIGGTILDSPFVNVNAFIMKTSLDGKINFRKIIKYDNREDLKDIKIRNNNYVITCETDTLDRRSAGMYIIDSIGFIVHRKIFYITDYSFLSSISFLPFGDIVFSGTVETNLPQRNDIYVVRADSTLTAKPLSIHENNQVLLKDYILYQNYPNPFNPFTKIKYEIFNKNIGTIQIKIFNLTGIELMVYKLDKNRISEIIFDGSNYPSGIYFYSLSIDDKIIQTKKMLFIK